jgi:hypothetical protein
MSDVSKKLIQIGLSVMKRISERDGKPYWTIIDLSEDGLAKLGSKYTPLELATLKKTVGIYPRNLNVYVCVFFQTYIWFVIRWNLFCILKTVVARFLPQRLFMNVPCSNKIFQRDKSKIFLISSYKIIG